MEWDNRTVAAIMLTMRDSMLWYEDKLLFV